MGNPVPLQRWLAHVFFLPLCTDAAVTDKLLGGLLRNFHALQHSVIELKVCLCNWSVPTCPDSVACLL